MEIHLQTTDHVVVVEKVAEQRIGTKLCSCNTYEDISHLLIMVIINKRVRGAPKGGLRTQETRLATALIKFRNKERNVRLPT